MHLHDATGRTARAIVARFFLGGLLAMYLPGCASAGEVEVPLNREVKKRFQQAESLGQFESIPAQCTVFTNQNHWNTFWTKYKITPPKLDFRTNAAFAVFAGQKPTSGYAVEIQRIFFGPERKILRFEVRDMEPPPNVATLSVLTFPYDIVAFSSPGEWKTVEVTRQKRKGKP